MRHIVDERRTEGATVSDASISSVCSEMLDPGIGVYLRAKNTPSSDEESPKERFHKALLTEAIKSRVVSQQILKLIFGIHEIKADSRNNYDTLVGWLKSQTKSRVESVYGKR